MLLGMCLFSLLFFFDLWNAMMNPIKYIRTYPTNAILQLISIPTSPLTYSITKSTSTLHKTHKFSQSNQFKTIKMAKHLLRLISAPIV